MTTISTPSDQHPTTAEQHPRGLYTLFGAEAWERFSYYGMRALLVLYMTKHLHFNRNDAFEVYALYTGLVYLTPLAGGWLADKVLGRRKAVLIGGLVMALGHLAMAFEPLLYPALGLLIVGNGFFKPNISTIVGGLYRDGDPRRDGAFTIFYMGINLGAFFAPLVCGNLGEKIGWHFGFSAAAIGMIVGLVVFARAQPLYGRVGLPPGRDTQDATVGSYRDPAGGIEDSLSLERRDYADVAVWTVGCTAFVAAVVFGLRAVGDRLPSIPGGSLTVLAVLFLLACGMLLFGCKTTEERQQVVVIELLCFFNIFFWMGFEQAGSTMTLFADDQTNRMLSGLGVIGIGAALGVCAFQFFRTTRDDTGGRDLWRSITTLLCGACLAGVGYGAYLFSKGQMFELPSSQFQSINPLIIVVMGPAFAQMWTRLDSGRYATSTPTKMALGMIILGLGFVIMFGGQSLATAGKVSPLWLATVYVFHTIGELCLSPIGLSMVTKLAPSRMVSLAMGMWLMSSALANTLAGKLEGLLSSSHVPIYGFLVGSSILPAVLLLSMTPFLKRWMHGHG